MSAPTDPVELLLLKRGWDSYDGLPPNPDTVGLAGVIGKRIEGLFSSPANYVPLSSGDVQIEWHCDGWDVEVIIERCSVGGHGTT